MRVNEKSPKNGAVDRSRPSATSTGAMDSSPLGNTDGAVGSMEEVLQRRRFGFSTEAVVNTGEGPPRGPATWGNIISSAMAPGKAPVGVQRMSVRGTDTASSLSAATLNKHVAAADEQEQAAIDGYASRTFVTDAAVITDIVDANDHDFTEAFGTASDRYNFQAEVSVSVYMKEDDGLGAGEPVEQTIDNAPTNCTIGVKKNGVDAIQVTHFMIA